LGPTHPRPYAGGAKNAFALGSARFSHRPPRR
jgi:hypothetical protein